MFDFLIVKNSRLLKYNYNKNIPSLLKAKRVLYFILDFYLFLSFLPAKSFATLSSAKALAFSPAI